MSETASGVYRLGHWLAMVWYGMVWYGMVYLFFHRQYKVISKQIASEMLPYTLNERRPPYNPISLNIIH